MILSGLKSKFSKGLPRKSNSSKSGKPLKSIFFKKLNPKHNVIKFGK